MLKLVFFLMFCTAFALLIPSAEATRSALLAETGIAAIVSALCGVAFLLSVVSSAGNRIR